MKPDRKPDYRAGELDILTRLQDAWYSGIKNLDGIGPGTDDSLSRLINDIVDAGSFLKALSNGDTSGELKAQGFVPGYAKSLQAALRHLSWQALRVASGDYTEHITFLGELADSYNTMLDRLTESRRLLLERDRQLEEINMNLSATVDRQVGEILDSRMSTIFALAKLAESRDHDTGGHLERTRKFCRLLCDRLSETPLFQAVIDDTFRKNMEASSPLHDIGKVAIPDAILLKQGPLTADEFLVIQGHSRLGAETLTAVRSMYPENTFISMGIEIALCHHERWDGTGYPSGISGIGIPLPARIMTVADVYDALRTKRCYKQPMDHDSCVRTIADSGGRQFDPAIVEGFLDVADSFDRCWHEMNP